MTSTRTPRGTLILLVISVLLNLLCCVRESGAGSLQFTFESSGSAIFPDLEGTLHRSDNGANPFEAYLTADPNNRKTGRYYFIPENGDLVQDIALKFRLEGIPDSVGWIDPSLIAFHDSSGTTQYPTITDSLYGMGSANFVEFTYDLEVVTSWYISQQVYIFFDQSVLGESTWSFMTFEISEPYRFEEAGSIHTGPIDRWFRLERIIWPAEFTDGSPWPEYIYRDYEPVSGESVDLEGTGVKFTPSSATTDSEGLFVVAAYVDPETFYEKRAPDGSLKQVAKGSSMGSLTMKYRQLKQSQGISGNFCVVIMVEGRVSVVEGSGAVSVGDTLVPGQKLSLSAGWGQRSQIGLRFVNGNDCSVSQDVFTNACITDLIRIGSSGIEDLSVISGNTPMASVARTLCEEVAGLPNTPEEWAKATGKVIVTTAASSVVAVGGITGYAIKYGVKKGTGKIYDYVVNSGGGNKSATWGTTPARMEFATYYDGSTRVTQSDGSSTVIYPAGSSEPIVVVGDNQWQEIVDGDTLGREWSEDVDSIDKSGPDLRFSYEYISETALSRFDLKAYDSAGLDPASLSVMFDSTDMTSSFHETFEGSGQWKAEFIGGTVGGTVIGISLADKLGHTSTLSWSQATSPGPPVITSVEPGYIGGKTTLHWTPPLHLDGTDVLFYEARMWGAFVPNSNWYSVGANQAVQIPVPLSLVVGEPFYIELRACDKEGRIGQSATTGPLYTFVRPSGGDFWAID